MPGWRRRGRSPGQKVLHEPQVSAVPAEASTRHLPRKSPVSVTFWLSPEQGKAKAAAEPAAAAGGGSQWKFMTKIRPGGDFTDLRAAPPPARELTDDCQPFPPPGSATPLGEGLQKGGHC